MNTTLFILSVWLLGSGQCKRDGDEINRLELSPFYDTIIFRDIAEIIDEIDNNMNFQQDTEVESNEDIENLLREYQHYLDKAHLQRMQYFDKNKEPRVRHENIAKMHTYGRNPNYYSTITFPQHNLNNPFNLFFPMHKNINYINQSESFPLRTLVNSQESSSSIDKIVIIKNMENDIPSSIHTLDNTIVSSCVCVENKFPCKCNCKQCLIPLGKTGNIIESITPFGNDSPFITHESYKNIEYSNQKTNDRLNGNKFDIRIKIDFQMPKFDDMLRKVMNFDFNKGTLPEKTNINEAIAPLNISFPSLDIPLPIKIFKYNGLTKIHPYDAPSLHKMILHKKKKAHLNNIHKNHRTKLFPFHYIKGDSYQTVEKTEKNDYYTQIHNTTQYLENVELNHTQLLAPNITMENVTNDFIHENETSTYAHKPFLLNISNIDNQVIEPIKIETVINTNDTKLLPTLDANFTRIKREVTLAESDIVNASRTIESKRNVSKMNITTITSNKDYNILEQVSFTNDLLYWPCNTENNTTNVKSMVTKNNNVNVSEVEPNISKVISKKKFVNINEKDIDGVVNTFTSLVGKYANGILTFCSENICRSIKCGEKICTYRNCLSENRFNLKGHCIPQNMTGVPFTTKRNERSSKDSYTACGGCYIITPQNTAMSMETFTNASPNIAFELIDSLQNKMLGKIFGKATICINFKCMTFEAIKKNFNKTKCSKKELNPGGHCPNLKNIKVT